MVAQSQTNVQDCAVIATRLQAEYQRQSGSDQNEEPDHHERRKSVRRAYHCLQLVAEFDGLKLPNQHDFQLCQFQDLSSGGVSFLLPDKPKSQKFIIALGSIPFNFFLVQMMRARCRDDLADLPFQVGCRFIRKLVGGEVPGQL